MSFINGTHTEVVRYMVNGGSSDALISVHSSDLSDLQSFHSP